MTKKEVISSKEYYVEFKKGAFSHREGVLVSNSPIVTGLKIGSGAGLITPQQRNIIDIAYKNWMPNDGYTKLEQSAYEITLISKDGSALSLGEPAKIKTPPADSRPTSKPRA